ncbi:hypothetical protein R3P38DRAFT_2660601 [Favolaschia claudopus]|uniref:F-box domain-containing protein n=1 Tax=Favolaschia claudopus TaxID=2862362 RepID=A0AAV9ZQC9_9AGAR
MHRCLDIAELVRLIFEELDPFPCHCAEYDSFLHIDTLLHLAKTCRQFSEPALDMLWRSHDGLVNVLKCLPAESWCVSDGYFRIISPVVKLDWQRPLANSTRIKNLCDPDPKILLHTSAVEAIVSLPAGILLPQVQHIIIESSAAIFPYISGLVGPRIHSIKLTLDLPSLPFSALHPIVPENRSLNYLSLARPGLHNDSAKDLVSAFILEMDNVRELDAQCLNELGYQHIATFPHLERLRLWDILELPFPCPPYHDSPFAALSSVTVHTSDVAFATNFIEVLYSSMLSEVCIISTENATTTNLAPLFSAIHTACHASQLNHLMISMEEDNTLVAATPNIYTLSMDFLRPLTVYGSMRSLKLLFPILSGFDDELMEELAPSWPQLEELFIGGHCRSIELQTSRRTVNSLISLAHFCPRLDTLSLVIDASRVPLGEYIGITHEQLRTWYPYDSPVGSPIRTAEYLACLFPCLSISTRVDKWKEVGDLLLEVQMGERDRSPSPLLTFDDLKCF